MDADPKRQSQVSNQLERYSGLADELKEMVSQLDERTSDVRLDKPQPGGEIAKEKEAEELVPLAEQIRCLNVSIGGSIARLRDIKNQIEL